MINYVGRTVMLKSGIKGIVIGETWESGPVLEIRYKKGKRERTVWLPDYEVVVL